MVMEVLVEVVVSQEHLSHARAGSLCVTLNLIEIQLMQYLKSLLVVNRSMQSFVVRRTDGMRMKWWRMEDGERKRQRMNLSVTFCLMSSCPRTLSYGWTLEENLGPSIRSNAVVVCQTSLQYSFLLQHFFDSDYSTLWERLTVCLPFHRSNIDSICS